MELEEIDTEREEEEGFQERTVKMDGEKWRVVTVYNRDENKELLDKVKEWIKEGEEEILVMAGDFNARIGKNGGWENNEGGDGEERESKDEILNKQGRDLVDLIEERGWIVLNGGKYGDEEGEWTYEKADKKSVIDWNSELRRMAKSGQV